MLKEVSIFFALGIVTASFCFHFFLKTKDRVDSPLERPNDFYNVFRWEIRLMFDLV